MTSGLVCRIPECSKRLQGGIYEAYVALQYCYKEVKNPIGYLRAMSSEAFKGKG